MDVIRATLSIRGIALLLGLVACATLAAPASEPAASLPEAAETCLMCHDDAATGAILQGPHAIAADARSRFAAQGCGSCHGSSEAHMRRAPRGSKRASPDHVFGTSADAPIAEQDKVCLDCHRGSAGMHWPGSAHEAEGIGCVSCHRLHSPVDPMTEPQSQAAACYACHPRTRAEMLRPSSHPLRDGRMSCSDCHDVHGGPGPSLLRGSTLNEGCYSCHADLRGPFLWEHPPAREDCSNCHRPHGSVHAPLLTQRTPWLCQQCHLAQFHPSTALSGSGLPGEALPSGSQSLLGRNCMNCHAQVHGSNHPSGAGQTR
jgi:DmsE family decaheme c-type cytochrome